MELTEDKYQQKCGRKKVCDSMQLEKKYDWMREKIENDRKERKEGRSKTRSEM